MKKITLKSSLLVGISTLLISFSAFRDSKLTDITKPYLGEYECISATLGEKDLTEKFSFVRLELNADESYRLYYRDKNGNKGEEIGTYSYDEQRQEISFTWGKHGELKRKFPMQDGTICLCIPIGKELLQIKLEQK